MSLSQIRGYINSRMPIIDPDLKEWQDSLEDIGNIPKTLLDNSYHIEIGTISSDHNDSHIEDSADITISVYKQTFNDQMGTRDSLLDTAHCIRMDLLNPLNVETYKNANSGDIEAVDSSSIEISAISETNDNIIKVDVGLNIRLFFGTT